MVRLEDGGVDEVYLYTADGERVAVIKTDGSSQLSVRWMIRDFNDQVVEKLPMPDRAVERPALLP